jgi:membrane fusion protein (multidrug efflux system)
VTEGALAREADGTLLAKIEQLDPIYVNFSQSSEELIELRRQSGGLARTVRLLLEDGSEYGLTGTLNFLDQSVDPTTGSVSLRATFPNPQRLLLPGQFVRVRIEARGPADPGRRQCYGAGTRRRAAAAPGQARPPRGRPVGRHRRAQIW